MSRLVRLMLFGAIARGAVAAQSEQSTAGAPNLRIMPGDWLVLTFETWPQTGESASCSLTSRFKSCAGDF